MKAARYVGVAIVVGMLGASALAGDTPSQVFGGQRAAAIAANHPKTAKDPLVNGSSSTSIPAGHTSYFIAVSTALEIPDNCTGVQVAEVSGNAFDAGNTGRLELRGMDVAVVFLDLSKTPIAINGILGAVSPNNSLFVAGYGAASTQPVSYALKDFTTALLPAPEFVEVIVEGDVTNSDTKAHSVGAAVTGIINFTGCTLP